MGLKEQLEKAVAGDGPAVTLDFPCDCEDQGEQGLRPPCDPSAEAGDIGRVMLAPVDEINSYRKQIAELQARNAALEPLADTIALVNAENESIRASNKSIGEAMKQMIDEQRQQEEYAPEFKRHLIIQAPAMLVDERGTCWWVDPAVKLLRRAI